MSIDHGLLCERIACIWWLATATTNQLQTCSHSSAKNALEEKKKAPTADHASRPSISAPPRHKIAGGGLRQKATGTQCKGFTVNSSAFSGQLVEGGPSSFSQSHSVCSSKKGVQ